METLNGKVMDKNGLPTYCYCYHRLLRAMNLASALDLFEIMDRQFSERWFIKVFEIIAAHPEFAELDVMPVVRKELPDKRGWAPVSRTVRIDLGKFTGITNNMRRQLFSSSEKWYNPMDCLICVWFRAHEEYLNFQVDKEGTKVLTLSDLKSPSTYKFEFMIQGQKYRVIIVGVKTTRLKRRRKSGRTTRKSLALEQAQTANATKIAEALGRANRVNLNNNLQFEERQMG